MSATPDIIMAELLGGARQAGRRIVDLLLTDDTPCRVAVLPGNKELLLEAHAGAIAGIEGEQRLAVLEALLALNHAVQRGRRFSIGLTLADIVCLHARLPVEGTDSAALMAALAELATQAGRVRGIVAALGLRLAVEGDTLATADF